MTKQEKDELKRKELQASAENDSDDDSDNQDDSDDTPAVKKPAGSKIEVDSDVLKQLLQELRETKATVEQLSSNAVAQSPGLQVRRKTRDFDYGLRKWDNKIVLGFENVGTEKRPIYVYNVYNPISRKEEQFVNLIIKGEDKPIMKIDYIIFLRDAEKILARMVSKKEIENVKEYGMIPKKEMAENGYGMFETMVLVPVEVVTMTYEMTLKLPEDEGGEQIVVNSQWLNL